ncbi:MAG TPA: EAL domain-containing protein [Polyangiales bacterium]|nr:EAL domain-containing protein [Polyangiales bacterium]
MSNPLVEEAVKALLDSERGPNLVYQPIVDLKRGEIAGYETLSRFPGPPVAGPDLWFAAARAVGRAVELEVRVLERALAARDTLPGDAFLSVNVAPEALVDERMTKLLRRGSLERVVFELTEHTMVNDYVVLTQATSEVRSRGGLVAVDDAGAGYAGLTHILSLRPDFVKLDRALIEGVHLDEAKSALVEILGTFTSRIDAWLLAEGIEEAAELERLIQLNVPLAQGYLLGRPAPEMGQLKPGIVKLVRNTERPDRALPHLWHALETGLPLHDDLNDEQQVAQLKAAGASAFGVLLDREQRPIGLVSAQGISVQRRAAMCVHESAPPLTILQRALTRPAERRFDPLACCDESGVFMGILRMERLIESILFPPTRKPSWKPGS